MTSRDNARPDLPFMSVLGSIALIWAASVYSAYGISAFPRQEWLVESLAAILFILPVVALLSQPGKLAPAVRIVGLMLLVHSLWDAAHWPGHAMIDTPIDPWIPKACPAVDVVLGMALLIRGK